MSNSFPFSFGASNGTIASASNYSTNGFNFNPLPSGNPFSIQPTNQNEPFAKFNSQPFVSSSFFVPSAPARSNPFLSQSSSRTKTKYVPWVDYPTRDILHHICARNGPSFSPDELRWQHLNKDSISALHEVDMSRETRQFDNPFCLDPPTAKIDPFAFNLQVSQTNPFHFDKIAAPPSVSNPFNFDSSPPSSESPFNFNPTQSVAPSPFNFNPTQPTASSPFNFSSSVATAANPFNVNSSQPTAVSRFNFNSSQPTASNPFNFNSSQPSATSPFNFDSSQPTAANPFNFNPAQPNAPSPFNVTINQHITSPFNFNTTQQQSSIANPFNSSNSQHQLNTVNPFNFDQQQQHKPFDFFHTFNNHASPTAVIDAQLHASIDDADPFGLKMMLQFNASSRTNGDKVKEKVKKSVTFANQHSGPHILHSQSQRLHHHLVSAHELTRPEKANQNHHRDLCRSMASLKSHSANNTRRLTCL